MTNRKSLADHFIAKSGWGESTRILVAGDASNRRYERLTNNLGKTVIFMDAPPDRGEDVRPFVKVADYLTNNGLSAPKIYHQDDTAGFLLIEDLGDDVFANLMAKDPSTRTALYQAATDVLVELHACPTLPLPICDAQWLTEMTAPAFEWYATNTADETFAQFQNVFLPMVTKLDSSEKVVILRDYHSENLLWLPERNGTAKVGLLDFQDALLGHRAYDLVSILQDARRDVPTDIEAAMITHYLSATSADHDDFRTAYAVLGAQRNLRILGIFARLCLRDGKAHYVDLIPRVWGYVMRNLENPTLAPLAKFITATLPQPTPEHLEHLKSQCGTIPQP